MGQLKRLFLAIKPDNAHMEALLNFMDFNAKSGIRWVKAENMHITCLFLGDTKSDNIPALIKKTGELLAGFHAFQLKAERFTFMPASKPRMIWLRFERSKEFTGLNSLLSRELLKKAPEYPARAHITLSRFKRPPKSHILFSKLPEKSLTAGEIILFESVLKPEGAVYIELYKWEIKKEA